MFPHITNASLQCAIKYSVVLIKRQWEMDQYSVLEIVSIFHCKYIRDKTLLNRTTQQSLVTYVCVIAPT